MRFGPWYPLGEAGDHAPAGQGVLQVRLATGLVDYPTGKSAMVWYEHAPDVRERALALAATHAGADLLCRHLVEIDASIDLGAFYAKLRTEFVRRFGALPAFDLAEQKPIRCT